MRPLCIVRAVMIAALPAFAMLAACTQEGDAAGETIEGANGGTLIQSPELTAEVKVDEGGGEPRFRLWVYRSGKSVPGGEVKAEIRTTRLGGAQELFSMTADGESLVSATTVPEPHSFDVTVSAATAGMTVEGSYPSYETRTEISPEAAAAAGVVTASVGPGAIRRTLTVYGSIIVDPERVRDIPARFPGIAVSVAAGLGERVRRGQALATIESNESLQRYVVASPIDGQVLARLINSGQAVQDEVIFTVGDLSKVWAEFAVFRRDISRVREGQAVKVISDDGTQEVTTKVAYIRPIGTEANQSLAVRAPLDNADGRWLPGLFVKGEIVIGERQVPMAVRNSALQTVRGLPVVFERVVDTYEPRFVEVRESDGEWTEVVGGISPGASYVVEQSYLIKADIEKSGAEHSH